MKLQCFSSQCIINIKENSKTFFESYFKNGQHKAKPQFWPEDNFLFAFALFSPPSTSIVCHDLCLLSFCGLALVLSLPLCFPQFPPACTHSPITLPTVFSLLVVSLHLSDPLFSSGCPPVLPLLLGFFPQFIPVPSCFCRFLGFVFL